MSAHRYKGFMPTRRVNSMYLQNVAYGAPVTGTQSVAASSITASSSPAGVVIAGPNLLLHEGDYKELMKLPKLFTVPFDQKVFVNAGLLAPVEQFVPPEYERDYLVLSYDILQGFKAVVGHKAWSDALESNQVAGAYSMLMGAIMDGKGNPAFPRYLWYGLLGAGGMEQAGSLALDSDALKRVIKNRMAEIASYIQQVEVTIETIRQTAIAQEAQRQAQVAAAAAQEPTQVDTIGPESYAEEGPVPGQFVPPSSVATAPTQAPPSIPTDLWAHDPFDDPGHGLESPTESLPSPTLPAILPEEEEKWYDKTENQVALGLGLLAAGYAIYKWSK